MNTQTPPPPYSRKEKYTILANEINHDNNNFMSGQEGFYLHKYFKPADGQSYKFDTLAEAMIVAMQYEDCKGITLEPRRGYTLRKGDKLKTGKTEEDNKNHLASWLKANQVFNNIAESDDEDYIFNVNADDFLFKKIKNFSEEDDVIYINYDAHIVLNKYGQIHDKYKFKYIEGKGICFVNY